MWWAHTLDWLYDSLSSPPVAGVWWAHTLDWVYDSLFLSTCSWCVVSAYTWLGLWLSLLSTCSWCVHWCRGTVAAVASAHWWWLRRDPPLMIVKRFRCTVIHNKALYKCIIHSRVLKWSYCNWSSFHEQLCFEQSLWWHDWIFWVKYCEFDSSYSQWILKDIWSETLNESVNKSEFGEKI